MLAVWTSAAHFFTLSKLCPALGTDFSFNDSLNPTTHCYFVAWTGVWLATAQSLPRRNSSVIWGKCQPKELTSNEDVAHLLASPRRLYSSQPVISFPSFAFAIPLYPSISLSLLTSGKYIRHMTFYFVELSKGIYELCHTHLYTSVWIYSVIYLFFFQFYSEYNLLPTMIPLSFTYFLKEQWESPFNKYKLDLAISLLIIEFLFCLIYNKIILPWFRCPPSGIFEKSHRDIWKIFHFADPTTRQSEGITMR